MQTDVAPVVEKQDVKKESNEMHSVKDVLNSEDQITKRKDLYSKYSSILVLTLMGPDELAVYEPPPMDIMGKLDEWASLALVRLVGNRSLALHPDQARLVGVFINKVIREYPLPEETKTALDSLCSLDIIEAVTKIVNEAERANPNYYSHEIFQEIHSDVSVTVCRTQYSDSLISYYRASVLEYGQSSDVEEFQKFLKSDKYHPYSEAERTHRLNIFLQEKIAEFEKIYLCEEHEIKSGCAIHNPDSLDAFDSIIRDQEKISIGNTLNTVIRNARKRDRIPIKDLDKDLTDKRRQRYRAYRRRLSKSAST